MALAGGWQVAAANGLLRLEWGYGRNKKGHCNGHEHSDVVEYREKIFCPRMKLSPY